MIYVLGDSFSWGYNFYQEKNLDRPQLIYPYHLGKKLNQNVTNLSLSGSSNWRIARLLMKLNLKPDDIIIIAWTETSRLEVPLSKNSIKPYEKTISIENFQNIENNDLYHDLNLSSVIEKNNNYYTRKLQPVFLSRLDHFENKSFANFCETIYNDYFDSDWAEDMFLCMFSACVHKLEKSRTKFRMFNTFRKPLSTDNSLLDIPQYILGYKSSMTEVLRPLKHKVFKSLNRYDTEYFSAEEHEKVAEIIYASLCEDY